jgi:hypothetical protein
MTWLPDDPLRGDGDTQINYFRVIRRYAEERFQALAREVIFRLQRTPAPGWFGDGQGFKSAWDEFCWLCQKGYDFTPPAYAYQDHVKGLAAGAVMSLSNAEAILLTCAASDELTDDPCRDDRELQRVVCALVGEMAGQRNVDRFAG